MNNVRILTGDTRQLLPTLADQSVQCIVTSPPYFALRDYGVAEQMGTETHPDAYVAALVAVFREARRVLNDDGTLWLNIGDSYAGAGYSNHANTGGALRADGGKQRHLTGTGAKNKDLLMIPARVALALQADGWYLRSDIIWHKPNPMPESVTDRPTSAHEHVFLFAKNQQYFYDAAAIAEPSVMKPQRRLTAKAKYDPPGAGPHTGGTHGMLRSEVGLDGGPTRNARNVWTIPTKSFRGAHFATMPVSLAERFILAGSKPGDTILDPFGGAGTTAVAAVQHRRKAILIELNPDYAALAAGRVCEADFPEWVEV